eukprot:2310040-Rhodomonas_salina.1
MRKQVERERGCNVGEHRCKVRKRGMKVERARMAWRERENTNASLESAGMQVGRARVCESRVSENAGVCRLGERGSRRENLCDALLAPLGAGHRHAQLVLDPVLVLLA